MSQVDSKGLINRIVVVKDDFSTVGIVTNQSVAKASVSVDSRLGSVARLGVSNAVQVIHLQALAGSVVNVGYASLLLVGCVVDNNRDIGRIVCYILVGYRLSVSRVALNSRTSHILEVLVCRPLSFQYFPSNLVDDLRSSVAQGILNSIWRLRTVAHHISNRPVNSVRQVLNVGIIWVICTALTRVDRLPRLAWVFRSDGDRAMTEVYSEGLVYLVVIVEDNFSTVGIVTNQSIAKASVSVDCGLSSVAGLSVSHAVQVIYLQALAGVVVNVGHGRLLCICRVLNHNLDVCCIMGNILVGYGLSIRSVARYLRTFNILEVLVCRPFSLNDLTRSLVDSLLGSKGQ